MNKQSSQTEVGTEKSKKNTKKCAPKSPSLCRSLSDRLVIPVKKYDPEVFRGLIHFVHCGSITITEETVAGLYCGAVRFELPDLSMACLDFVDRSLAAGRHSTLLTSTRQYSQHSAVKTLFDKVSIIHVYIILCYFVSFNKNIISNWFIKRVSIG